MRGGRLIEHSKRRFGFKSNDIKSIGGMHMLTEEKVIAIVCEQLGVKAAEVKRTSSFAEDLKADSLDVVELVMEFEDEFGITIPDEDYAKIGTVGDAIDYIEDKK